MSSLKKLASQTLWYGVPTIVSRFLSYGLNLLGFRLFNAVSTSDLTQIYAVIPFLNILFTYGLETSYFRFAQHKEKKSLYNTLMVSILLSTIFLTTLLFIFKSSITNFIELNDHPEYVNWMIWILFFDTLSVLPFARLRQEGRPRKYAFIKVANILLTIVFVIFFLFICKPLYEKNPGHPLLFFYDPKIGVGYFIIANLLASALTLIFLFKELAEFRFIFDRPMWKEVMIYSYPLIIVGLGGMINEMLSRLVYRKVLHVDPIIEKRELGIFGANYKLAVLITIFIQVFRLAAEPFFFSQSHLEDAKRTYARVMKFFVMACCMMFLAISLFLDAWQILIASRFKEYAEGIHIVPILAMGSVFLGIYYNLSVWYKLTNRNMVGAYITVAGALVTILLNIWWIPIWGYTGSAWATFVCYGFMMVASYLLGQKYYKIPYPKKKLIAYLVISALLYLFHQGIIYFTPAMKVLHYFFAVFFLGIFILLIVKIEKKEFQKLPVIGKYI